MQSQNMFFPKISWGGMPPDPPSIRMLSVLCTLLFNSHTLGRTYQKLLPPPLVSECLSFIPAAADGVADTERDVCLVSTQR